MDFIFIHGAPGTGKSSVAKELHNRLICPWFEFGWIPEFHQKKEVTLSYNEEEAFTFENLVLVARNYVRHGFENVIITDLSDPIMEQVPQKFRRYCNLFVTLWVEDQEVLKSRILNETRSSGYRDWEASLRLNEILRQRPPRANELRFNSTHQSVSAIVDEIVKVIESHRIKDGPSPMPCWDSLSNAMK